MANYDIPQYPTKRLRYFNNQFLKDQDFIDIDASQLGHERALLRSLCVAGVCEGLVVTYPAPNKPPSVSAGVAIDKTGRMILVDQPTDGLANPGALADGDYVVHISFLESEDDKATGQGAPDYTRWKQTPAINATAKTAALPDGVVVLGSCTVTGGVFVGAGTTVGRQYSGLRLPGPNKDVTATLRNTGASDDLAMLTGSLIVRRDTLGQIGPTLTLQNSAGSTGAGGAIDFNGYDPGTNDPSLRMRSLDDGNSSGHLTFSTKQPGAQTNTLVERLRITSTGNVGIGTQTPNDILHVRAADTVGLLESSTTQAALRLATSEGMANHVELANRPGGRAAIWVGTAGDALNVMKGGNVGIGTQTPSNILHVRAAEAVGLFESSTTQAALRLATSEGTANHVVLANRPGGNAAIWVGTAGDALVVNKDGRVVVSKASGGVGDLTIENYLRFPNEAPKDKIVIWDNGATDRFGIGLNGSNINLFCATNARFSLRQNSSTGTEVFTIDAAKGNAWTAGSMTFQQPGGSKRFSMYCESGSGSFVIYPPAGNGVYFSPGSGWSINSDASLKEGVVAHEPVLDRVMQLRPVRFRWKSEGTAGSGFIAQEVEALFPDLVGEGSINESTGRRLKGMVYDRFGVLAVAAIKELKMDYDARLDALERKLAAQGGKS